MTREEAISLLMQVNKILVNSNSWLENTHEPLNKAFDMAIKALEQEPILDKIRAEIESLERFEMRGEKTPIVNGDKALAIIDRYTAEMESEE